MNSFGSMHNWFHAGCMHVMAPEHQDESGGWFRLYATVPSVQDGPSLGVRHDEPLTSGSVQVRLIGLNSKHLIQIKDLKYPLRCGIFLSS